MSANPDDFGDLFTLKPGGPDRFISEPPGEGFLFGGMSMALSLRAAAATVSAAMAPKSLHMLFLNAGRWGPPLDLRVEHLTDSRAFSTRRVAGDQDGTQIVAGMASFHLPEEGDDWQLEAPDVAPPERLEARPFELGHGARPAEIRPVLASAPGASEIIHPYWGRPRRPIPADDPALRSCVVVFLTDYLVIATPFPRGSGAGAGKLARTLEHSIWFHRPVLDDDWLLYSCDATTVVGGRALSQGTVHDRAGRLVATFVQQGMIRNAPGS